MPHERLSPPTGRRAGSLCGALACLLISIGPNAMAEESKRKAITLEEMTTVCFIQRPSVFFHVDGRSQKIAPQEAVSCTLGGKSSRPCGGREKARGSYEEAHRSWSKVEEQRRRLLELGTPPSVKGKTSRGDIQLPRREDVRGTEPHESADLVVASLDDGSPRDLGEIVGYLLQARRVMEKCYARAVDHDATFSEYLSFQLDIEPDGKVRDAQAADLGVAKKAGDCIVPFLNTLSFSAHEGSRASRFGVFYRPRSEEAGPDDDAPTDRAPPGAYPRVVSKALPSLDIAMPPGPFSISIVHHILMSKMSGFRACYQRYLRERPGASGHVTVSFVIESEGNVSTARVEDSTLPASVGNCITTRILTLDMPPPEGGDVPLTHTFVFRP